METATMASTYVLVTLTMFLLAWLYNKYIEGEGSCMPTSVKVTGGVFGTEVCRVTRLVLMVHLAWPVIGQYIPFTETQVILGILAFWFTDVLSGYGPTGAPMIRGDFQRMRRVRTQSDTADNELAARNHATIDKATETITSVRSA